MAIIGTPHAGHRRWPIGGGVVGSNLRGWGIRGTLLHYHSPAKS